MAVRVRFKKPGGGRKPAGKARGGGKGAFFEALWRPAGKVALAVLAAVLITGLSLFTFFYIKYARLIEEKLTAGPFAETSMLFAAPEPIMLGERLTVEDLILDLRRRGYSQSRTNRMGWYNVRPDGIEIFPGTQSYFKQDDGVIKFEGNRVSQIILTRDSSERAVYYLEPELITNLFDAKREKRRLVEFGDIPKVLRDAVVSVEDKRFFSHSGFDPLRIIRSAYDDLKEGRKAYGASTLSMQLARQFWLSPDKTWRRKAAEVLITLHLEHKLTKEQIFTYYANQVPLGRRGSFNVHGFGEASRAYFGKDISQLNLQEAATLAGVIQSPSRNNPIRWPERARTRRNLVLSRMRENGHIADRDYALAVASPLEIAKGGVESTDAPYFVDLVNDELQEEFQQHDFQNKTYRVYTSLDLNLQREAAEAVRVGLAEVDKLLDRRRRKGARLPEAQVSLVALDAQTGEVKALIGGRNYGLSQLNRALAKRQPGSIFKPFVYAAALNTAVSGNERVLTPLTTVVDQPTTFWFDSKPYEPGNFKDEYHGTVTIRQALAQSMNVPTVKVAEAVGYEAVVDLARKAGMNLNIRPTPAVALGAYEVTPLEMAGAYTVFANRGVNVKPTWIKQIRNDTGSVIFENKPQRRTVLDPRVAYMMVNLMEDVINSGTGAGVRSRGFSLPAAGKTGTSHDGWFAGFTSKLICIVWVGFDDNSQLNLEGAKSALPIWTEFMKRAHRYREFRGVKEFDAPDGVVTTVVDPESGQLASTGCSRTRTEVFVAGSQPIEVCRLHGGGIPQIAGWDPDQRPLVAAVPQARDTSDGSAATPPAGQPPVRVGSRTLEPERQEEKKGFFRRLRDIFR